MGYFGATGERSAPRRFRFCEQRGGCLNALPPGAACAFFGYALFRDATLDDRVNFPAIGCTQMRQPRRAHRNGATLGFQCLVGLVVSVC